MPAATDVDAEKMKQALEAATLAAEQKARKPGQLPRWLANWMPKEQGK